MSTEISIKTEAFPLKKMHLKMPLQRGAVICHAIATSVAVFITGHESDFNSSPPSATYMRR